MSFSSLSNVLLISVGVSGWMTTAAPVFPTMRDAKSSNARPFAFLLVVRVSHQEEVLSSSLLLMMMIDKIL